MSVMSVMSVMSAMGLAMTCIEVGCMAYVYQNPERRGHMLKISEVAEVVHRDGETFCLMTHQDLGWIEISRLAPAERPPEGFVTKFNVGDRVQCYATYQRLIGIFTIEHIVWCDGQADYYVNDLKTPWYCYNDNSLSPAPTYDLNDSAISVMEGFLF